MARQTMIKKADIVRHQGLLRYNHFYGKLHDFIEKNFSNLNFIPGSEHTNYYISKEVTFFKIEPCLDDEVTCIHISVCDEDYPLFSEEFEKEY